MARKGAMAKEPVLRGEARRAAKVARRAAEEGRPETSPPVRATPRREKAGERLSPGVYRGDRGGLVGQGGRPIQRQPQPPMGQQIAGGMQAQPSDYQNLPGPGGQGPQMPMDQVGMQAGAMPGMPQDKMYRFPQMPQMPQASANMGGQYRLSPGVYGTRDQAMQQYNQQMQQMYQPINGLGQQGNMPPMDWSSWGPMVPYGQRRG